MINKEIEIKCFNYNFSIDRIYRDSFIGENELITILDSDPSDRYYNLYKLNFINWLQKTIDLLIKEGNLDEQLLVKQEDWGIKFIGGIDAVRYCDSMAKRHVKQAKKHNRRLFNINLNNINHSQRDEYQHYLQESQAREALLNRVNTKRIIQ